MPYFAVSSIDIQKGPITTSIVEATDWKAAAMQHPQIAKRYENTQLEEGLEEAKEDAEDEEFFFEVVEITEASLTKG